MTANGAGWFMKQLSLDSRRNLLYPKTTKQKPLTGTSTDLEHVQRAADGGNAVRITVWNGLWRANRNKKAAGLVFLK